jgi:hypothetical protein
VSAFPLNEKKDQAASGNYQNAIEPNQFNRHPLPTFISDGVGVLNLVDEASEFFIPRRILLPLRLAKSAVLRRAIAVLDSHISRLKLLEPLLLSAHARHKSRDIPPKIVKMTLS